MPYVYRSGGAEITGIRAWPKNEGDEFLTDDHVDVLAFTSRDRRPVRIEAMATGDEFIRSLIAVLADQFAMTPRQLIDAMKAKL